MSGMSYRPASGGMARVWKVFRCPRCYDARVSTARRGTWCRQCTGPGLAVRMNVESWVF